MTLHDHCFKARACYAGYRAFHVPKWRAWLLALWAARQ